jgi:NAD(P)H-flavin reductase
VHLAAILETKDVGGGLVSITLRVSPEVSVSYSHVGQYAQVTVGAASAYFFLAGLPNASTWTFVVKPQGEVAEHMARAAVGTAVKVSAALGEGYDWSLVQSQNLALMLVGSGFGAAFSIARKRLADGDAVRTHLYVGVANPEDPPAPSFLLDLLAAGVKVSLCTLAEPTAEPSPLAHAQPGEGNPTTFPLLRGPMEHAIATLIHGHRETWTAIVVGPKGLVASARALQSSLPKLTHVLSNV